MTWRSRLPTGRVSILRGTAVVGLALGAVAVLAGCTGVSPSGSSTTAAATSGAGSAGSGAAGGSGASSGSEGAGSATPTGGAGALDATAFSRACDELAPEATVTAAYPGMTATSKPRAPKKSDAAVIGSYDGTVCSWKNDSGTTMTLAVGRFSDASLTTLKNSLVTSSNPVPTYQGEGYFDLDGATGTAEAFTGDYWIVATSADPVFAEPGGAEPLVDAAIAALAS